MFKKILKFIFFFSIIALIGLSISKGISFLEKNISFEKYISMFSSKIYSSTKEEIIFSTIEESSKEILEEENSNILLGIPVHIEIPSVGIKLDIREGEYNYQKQTWTLTNGFAYWANLSNPIFSSNSNTVIYAHNQKNEFSKTKDLEIGDEINITTDKKQVLTFEYTKDYIVDPTNESVIFQKVERSQVILITCNGLFSENRRIMIAELIQE